MKPVPPTWPPEEPVTLVAAGSSWVSLYPTSRDLADLALPFQTYVRSFLADLASRGCTVHIAATRRPAERAWLMRQSWDIVHEGLAPYAVQAHDPAIPIIWTYEGAKAMVAAYGLAYRPSLTSLHIRGLAIDMACDGWTGTKSALYHLGATHGVIKLISDPPHWSSTGR